MQIKVSKYVDASDEIYLPYLYRWAYYCMRAPPNYNSDLLGLVQKCVIIFSEQLPVFWKPKNQPQTGLSHTGPLGGRGGHGQQPSACDRCR